MARALRARVRAREHEKGANGRAIEHCREDEGQGERASVRAEYNWTIHYSQD